MIDATKQNQTSKTNGLLCIVVFFALVILSWLPIIWGLVKAYGYYHKLL